MERSHDLRLAVLIDADNVPYANISAMLGNDQIRYANLQRIYADWTKPTVSGWKSVLLEHCNNTHSTIQLYNGKECDRFGNDHRCDGHTLYSGRVDGFCLVSSDSDFTRLATKTTRVPGMKVFGERKLRSYLISACDKFIYVEILSSAEQEEVEATVKPVSANVPKDTTTKQAKQAILKPTGDWLI